MNRFWESVFTSAADIYEPHNAWGLAGLLVVNLAAIITAVGVVWVVIRQRRNEGKVAEVGDKVDWVAGSVDQANKQLVNGHADKDPLRTDVDKLLRMAEETNTAVGKVHTAVTAETAARRTAIEGLNDRLGGIEEHLRKG